MDEVKCSSDEYNQFTIGRLKLSEHRSNLLYRIYLLYGSEAMFKLLNVWTDEIANQVELIEDD